MTIPPTYLKPAQTVGIVYWGRSGTILLHSLLDSHPDVLSCNGFFWMFSWKMDEFLASEHGSSSDDLLNFVCETYPYLFEHWPTFFPEMFRGRSRDLKFGTDRERFVAAFREYLSYFPNGTPFECLPDGHTIHSFVLQAIHVAYAIAQGQPLTSNNPTIIWQTHFWQADFFRQRFPNIRILSAIRHPLKSFDAWSVRGFVDERVPPFWFYHALRIREMMEFTKVPIDIADRCRAVRFEDIHNRTERVMRAVADWLNIRWDPCLLKSTFDGEPYWGVKGGCNHLVKHGEVAPAEAVVTGTRAFDESNLAMKELGIVDRIRTQVLCRDAFNHWDYKSSTIDRLISNLLKRCTSLLLMWPSRLDRKCFVEDFRHDQRTVPLQSAFNKSIAFIKALAKFGQKKWQFRREILEIQRRQVDWPPIKAVFVPGTQMATADEQPNEKPAMRRAA